MSTVTKEIMNLARKAGYEGEDKNNVVKAIDALADTLAGENLEQATNIAAAIKKLQPYINNGSEGGNPYEYLGIEFITIDIVSHTLPDSSMPDPVELKAISVSSNIYHLKWDRPFGVSTPEEPSINQIIVPIASEKTTRISLDAETNYGLVVPDTITATGGVSFDGDICVTGPGSITNITWSFSD